MDGELEALKNRIRELEIRVLANEKVPPALQARQVAFLHIMKTAGTSLHHWLRAAMPETPVFHGDELLFDQTNAHQFAFYGLLLGHFSYRHIAKFRRPFVITFLRDPVDRVVSVYYWLKTFENPPPSVAFAVEVAKSKSFEYMLDHEDLRVRRLFDNQQTYALAGDWRDERVSLASLQERVFQRAREHLSRIDFVGSVANFEADVARLGDALGLGNLQPAPRLNVTEGKTEVSSQIRRRIEELNVMDRALFSEGIAASRAGPRASLPSRTGRWRGTFVRFWPSLRAPRLG